MQSGVKSLIIAGHRWSCDSNVRSEQDANMQPLRNIQEQDLTTCQTIPTTDIRDLTLLNKSFFKSFLKS